MLYHLYDWHHAAWEPMRLFVQAGQRLFSHPALPFSYTGMGRTAAAMCEMVERGTRRYAKPAFGFDHTIIDGEEVAIAEETVFEKPFCALKHFRRATTRKDPAPLDRGAALGTPRDAVARHRRGAVAVARRLHHRLDQRERGAASAGAFDLDDYIEYVIEFLQHIGPGTHVMAVCQPSVPVLAAVSLMSADDKIRRCRRR